MVQRKTYTCHYLNFISAYVAVDCAKTHHVYTSEILLKID